MRTNEITALIAEIRKTAADRHGSPDTLLIARLNSWANQLESELNVTTAVANSPEQED